MISPRRSTTNAENVLRTAHRATEEGTEKPRFEATVLEAVWRETARLVPVKWCDLLVGVDYLSVGWGCATLVVDSIAWDCVRY